MEEKTFNNYAPKLSLIISPCHLSYKAANLFRLAAREEGQLTPPPRSVPLLVAMIMVYIFIFCSAMFVYDGVSNKPYKL